MLISSHLWAAPIIEGERAIPQLGRHGMVVTSHPIATKYAHEVLQNGGNAIDAAVTAGFVLAVTQPRSGNIGGGGFMLISSEATGRVETIDYREKAPAAATRDMFLDSKGNVDKNLSRFSHKSAGVPGTVAGLLLALSRYGTISRQRALAPAISLAEKGFPLPERFVKGTVFAKDWLVRSPASKKVFFKKDGSAYKAGEIFVQRDLAATLKRVAKEGRAGFYQGKTAQLVADDMRKHGGLITIDDLQDYQPKLRRPVVGTYRGYEVFSMGPPSSGGVHVIQLLKILEGYPLKEYGFGSAKTIHLMAEAMKRVYADRAKYLGDEDFVKVPVAGLTSASYAGAVRDQLGSKATPSQKIGPGRPPGYESNETTHFSIVDGEGNAVSNTYTINFSYGSGIVVAGAGFLLNNEMDDFSAKPGVANGFGLIGDKANQIEPGKRMLSSMSPTIVKKGRKNFLVTGSPGGSRIITTTLQVILNVVDHGMNVQSAVNAPRIHHQWLPDEIRIEEGISPDTIKLLEGYGHKVVRRTAMGAIQSILIKEDGAFLGAPDPRRSTSSAIGVNKAVR